MAGNILNLPHRKIVKVIAIYVDELGRLVLETEEGCRCLGEPENAAHAITVLQEGEILPLGVIIPGHRYVAPCPFFTDWGFLH